jgi:hypothetical protein
MASIYRPLVLRSGSAQRCVQAFRVEADHHLAVDDDGGGDAAAMDLDQVPQRLAVAGYVELLELHTLGQEILSQ